MVVRKEQNKTTQHKQNKEKKGGRGEKKKKEYMYVTSHIIFPKFLRSSFSFSDRFIYDLV